jgi:hypothetical protein
VLEPPPRPCTKTRSAITGVVSSGSYTVFRPNSFLGFSALAVDLRPENDLKLNLRLMDDPNDAMLALLVVAALRFPMFFSISGRLPIS